MTYVPRFTFTTEGLAAIYLRKHFGDRASATQISALAEMIEDCVGQAVLAEQERCVKVCDDHAADIARGHDLGQAYSEVIRKGTP